VVKNLLAKMLAKDGMDSQKNSPHYTFRFYFIKLSSGLLLSLTP